MTNDIVEGLARAIYTTRNGKWDYNAYRADPRIAEAYRKDAQAALTHMQPIIAPLVGALDKAKTELWWCANQLGMDWKDREWVSTSSVGRAYTAAAEALSSLPDELKGKG